MRRASDCCGWASHVQNLAAEPELACIRSILEALSANQLADLDPLDKLTPPKLSEGDLRDLWIAAGRIEQEIPSNPYGSLLAAIVVLWVWSRRATEELYGQVLGMPDPGWAQFPYVCAAAALKSGAIDEGVRLVDRSVEVLKAAKYQEHPRLRSALTGYRALGAQLERKWRSALENLAVDLRESCRTVAPNFRAEFGAILWALGLFPESDLFVPGSSPTELPPLRLCRHVVHISLTGMAMDPLVQHVWLAMKDREPFNLRDHPVFFRAIDLCYPSSPVDDFALESPSAVFARTLIAWFSCDLSRELAESYVDAFELVEALFPNRINWTDYIRMRMLALMVGQKFGLFSAETLAHRADIEAELVNAAASVNRNAELHPEWPELYTRMSGPMFLQLDELGKGGCPVAARIEALEAFRAAVPILAFATHMRKELAKAGISMVIYQPDDMGDQYVMR